MKPDRLIELVKQGSTETHSAGEIFYSLDFKEELYIVKSGYVKRYAVTEENIRVIESIYGPGYFFPLTPVFKKLLNFNLSQESNTYVYQAMTNVEIQGISSELLVAAVAKTPELYADLLYEAGVRLRANINRLSSNALKDDYKKVTHQLAYLAEEFGEIDELGVKTELTIQVPLESIDIAEQLNIDDAVVIEAFQKLIEQGVMTMTDRFITILDVNLLKDAYL
jgi:CRP-like cAMP-binding protein